MKYNLISKALYTVSILTQILFLTISLQSSYDKKYQEFHQAVSKINQKLSQNISQNNAFMQSFETLVSIKEEDAIFLVDSFAKTIVPRHPRITQIAWFDVGDHSGPQHAHEVWSYPIVRNNALKQAVIEHLSTDHWHGMRVYASEKIPNHYLMIAHSQNDNNHFVIVMLLDAIAMLDIPAEENINVDWMIGATRITHVNSARNKYTGYETVFRSVNTPLTISTSSDYPTIFPALTKLIIERKIPYWRYIPYKRLILFFIIVNIITILLFYLVRQKQDQFLLKSSREAAVAEAKRLEHENRLEHAARINTIGELTSGIVHELSQPLSAILSHSQAGLLLIRREKYSTNQLEQALTANARDAKRAGQLLQKFREYLSNRKNEEQSTSLNEAVTDIASILSPELKWNNIDLQLCLSPSPLFSLIDKIELEQVIHNLIGNSIEALSFSRHSVRRIDVSTRGSGTKNIIRISDNGPGIDACILKELFQPFVTSKSNGMGLGLSICQRIVTRAGGNIKGHNDSGAVFTVTLPALTRDYDVDS